MRPTFLLAVSSALACAAPAQVAPAALAPTRLSPVLNLNVPPLDALMNGTSSDILGVSAVKIPGAPPGQWFVCLSLRSPLSNASCPGCAGLGDLVMGNYQLAGAGGPSFTITNEAVNLNTADGDRFLQIEPRDGLKVVFEKIYVAGGVRFASIMYAERGMPGMPFGSPVPVDNVYGVGNYADPAIGYVNEGSRLMLFYLGVNRRPDGRFVEGVWMDELTVLRNMTTQVVERVFVDGSPELVIEDTIPRLPNQPFVHSPTPIAGADGDVEGLWYAVGTDDRSATPAVYDSDMVLAADLDPQTGEPLAIDGGTNVWLNNGAILGPLLLSGTDGGATAGGGGANPQALTETPTVWLIGDTEPAGTGGTLDFDVRVGGPPGTVAFLFASPTLAPAPTPAFGFLGLLGLDLPAVQIGPAGGVTTTADGFVDARALSVPNGPGLSGVRIPIQAAAITPGGQQVFTNTAWLRVR